jgi:predicted AAA+ superfamily ATPase
VLFQKYVQQYGEPTYLIIDEIQDIKDREFFIRGMYAKKKYHIIITGSNSRLLSSELSTFLTGRVLSIEVLNFSYVEFLGFTKQISTLKTFEEYASRGGLPEVILQSNELLKRHYLQDTLATMLYQDIIKRYKVENEVLAEKILKFLAENIGNLTSLRNIEKYMIAEKLKVSVATISKYV